MDENQALLGKDSGKQERNRPYSYRDEYLDEVHGSSSEDSAEWWEDSQSSCGTSCCSTDSGSSFAWEEEITSNGELFFVECTAAPLSNSSDNEEQDASVVEDRTKSEKSENEKKGKFARWMRRRQSKRQRQKLSVAEVKNPPSQNAPPQLKEDLNKYSEGMKQVIVKIESFNIGESHAEKVLGVKTISLPEEQKVVITDFVVDSPVSKCKDISIGDTLCAVNDENVTPLNFEKILKRIGIPSEVVVQVESRSKEKSKKTSLARRLIEKDKMLETVLENQPIGLVFVNVENASSDKKDIVYSFPSESVLSSSRGSFITLYHLLSEITASNTCRSSTITIKKQLSHVVYTAEGKCLLLTAIPDSRCSLREALNIVNDLVRCLLFNHQTLNRCFTTCDSADLNHFFAVFFSRVLTNGFSPDNSRSIVIEDIPLMAAEPSPSQFEDILPYVSWIPLPKEAQIQLDDALNELEANDLDFEGADNIENQRLYTIVGSCFYHKGYLLASHLPKDDLLDVNSFCRQNCITQLMRTESVKSLIVWREVFPSSVERGLPPTTSTRLTIPGGRWFLLIVGQRHDLLAVLLESGGCCVKPDKNPGPSVEYIEETEDTLRHIQKLGISGLASEWLKDNVTCQTVTPEDIFYNKTNRKKDNILSFVRTASGQLDGNARPQESGASPNPSRSPGDVTKQRSVQTSENSEDSISQAPSNVSEMSDENVPILGRRAERVKNAILAQASDSDNSDSDWESFKDSNRYTMSSGGGSSGILRGLCYSDVNDIIPSKLTTGPENVLFHYVHLDSSEGVFMCPTTCVKNTTKMEEVLNEFRQSALFIHSLLENNVRFKKNGQDDAKCLINKSLIAVKEHGILFECAAPDQDLSKRRSFSYWVVGRLFFTPQPREVYVCYYDDAPQNLVEIAFRLGLNAAG